MATKPNVIILLADQLRAQALGYAGDVNARTPRIDALARQSVNFSNTITCCPLCSPARASLLTGQFPLSHRVIINDVHLGNVAPSIASVFRNAGYDTAYIGKWHLDGSGNRSAFIPKDRRQEFSFWSVLECTHDYYHSLYWGDDDMMHQWKGYDAIAQSKAAREYIKSRDSSTPFFLVVSWGPPHDPYRAVSWQFKRKFPPGHLDTRLNVPDPVQKQSRKDLSGYYAHVSALDYCCGMILDAVKETGIEKETIIVFMSDHGDLLGSHGLQGKQAPWDESIRIPLLIKDPRMVGGNKLETDYPINVPDIMPTILSLCNLPVPDSVEGRDRSGVMTGGEVPVDGAALFACYSPICNWHETGKEYRGIRTSQHTFVRSLQGPWLLYDNIADPFQLHNLVGNKAFSDVQDRLDTALAARLKEIGDEFLPGEQYLKEFGYHVGPDGAVPYKN
ncbi:MAG TPA: sulfatase [Candidatus Lokiarchaeia archaeon]|nr:sulfatase [Candidatus Lokiarchaeia archaeon]